MLRNWVTSVWLFIAGYVRWADAWTLFVSGVMAAGITIPANGQPNRVWVLATLVILFNVAINAIRRAKVTITTSPSIGVKVMDPITTLVTAIEAALVAFKNSETAPVQVTTNPAFTTSPTVVSPNQNVTYPFSTPATTVPLVPENASEALAQVAKANEANAAAALVASSNIANASTVNAVDAAAIAADADAANAAASDGLIVPTTVVKI